ncbi:hypothetical protein IWW50_006853, partial [Coemansia erecta]
KWQKDLEKEHEKECRMKQWRPDKKVAEGENEDMAMEDATDSADKAAEQETGLADETADPNIA